MAALAVGAGLLGVGQAFISLFGGIIQSNAANQKKDAKLAALNREKGLFYNNTLPLYYTEKMQSLGATRNQLASTGQSVNSLGSNFIMNTQDSLLSTKIENTKLAKDIEYQAIMNQILLDAKAESSNAMLSGFGGALQGLGNIFK
jgi:hypothetical protein